MKGVRACGVCMRMSVKGGVCVSVGETGWLRAREKNPDVDSHADER